MGGREAARGSRHAEALAESTRKPAARDAGPPPLSGFISGRTELLAGTRAGEGTARKPARQMFRAAAGTAGGKADGAAAGSGARAVRGQGRATSGPRPARRLGAGTVGRAVPRARLQAQRLAHAMPRRDARSLVESQRHAADVAGAAARLGPTAA